MKTNEWVEELKKTSEWLKSLKEGDKAIIHKHLNDDVIVKVKRLTKTQIVVEQHNHVGNFFERKFRISDGCEVPSNTWLTSLLIEASEDRLNSIKAKNARQEMLKKISKAELTLEQIEQINKIMRGEQ